MKFMQRSKLMIGVTGCALCLAAAAAFGVTRPMYDPILKEKTERIETRLKGLKTEKNKAMGALLTVRKTNELCAVYNPTTEQKAKCNDVLISAIDTIGALESKIANNEKALKSIREAFIESGIKPMKTVIGFLIAGVSIFILSAIAYAAPAIIAGRKMLRENQVASPKGEQK